MTQDVSKLDPNFAVKDPEAGLVWYDAKNLPIEGKGWSDTAGFYDRLPARAKDMVPPNVYHLAQRSAGLSVRFMTDSPAISARWKLNFEPQGMSHMPATGEAGLGLQAAMALGGHRHPQDGQLHCPTHRRLVPRVAAFPDLPALV